MDFKTFSEWPQVGRSVRSGQKARYYLVAPDGSTRIAVFSEDQTEDIYTVDRSDWVLTPIEELEPAGKRKPGTKGFVKIDTYDGGTTIWCGSDKEIIAFLKRRGYVYHGRLHRWFKPNTDCVEVAEKMEAGNYTVERLFACEPMV